MKKIIGNALQPLVKCVMLIVNVWSNIYCNLLKTWAARVYMNTVPRFTLKHSEWFTYAYLISRLYDLTIALSHIMLLILFKWIMQQY